MRSPDELAASALAVLDLAYATPAEHVRHGRRRHKYPTLMAPLFSGGHDSLCACHVASRHPRFGGEVFHIDTGIGAAATRAFVEATCRELGWRLRVHKSPSTYEQFVRDRGFPGPAMHQWAYIRLKERCVRQITARRRVVLVTGCRKEESTRRMGHVEPLKVGEVVSRNGVERVEQKNRWWSAPCHDWTAAEQAAYMEEHDLPRNPLKATLGMSGECFCGAFARPNEIELVRRWAPDVAAEIDRLAGIAAGLGKHAVWGTRPPGRGEKGTAVVPTGPLCTGCDRRAAAAGVVFVQLEVRDGECLSRL